MNVFPMKFGVAMKESLEEVIGYNQTMIVLQSASNSNLTLY